MEKYAVVLDDEKTKTAGSRPTCPKCGRDLIQHTDDAGFVMQSCPECGLEPFEKKEN